jgi:hypothetical protein
MLSKVECYFDNELSKESLEEFEDWCKANINHSMVAHSTILNPWTGILVFTILEGNFFSTNLEEMHDMNKDNYFLLPLDTDDGERGWISCEFTSSEEAKQCELRWGGKKP